MLNVGAAEIYKFMQLCLYKYSSLYLEMIRRVFAVTILCKNHVRKFVHTSNNNMKRQSQ